MIPARKQPLFNYALRRWLTRVLRRRFHNVYLTGTEHLRALPASQPVIGCVNHTNWWDGFILYVLSHRLLPHDIYLVMEEKNLRRYRFFTWMGVFGVDLTDRRAALPGLRYALRLLRSSVRSDPPRLIWTFVQGRLCRPQVPVEAKPGATFLAAHADALLLPLTLRYEFLGESRPGVFVRVGPPLTPTSTSREVADTLNGLLAETDRTLELPDLSGYERLFAPAMSMNKHWDYLVHLFLRRRGVFDKENG